MKANLLILSATLLASTGTLCAQGIGGPNIGIGYVLREAGPGQLQAELPRDEPNSMGAARRPIVEITSGAGYAFGSGAENPAPTLASGTLGATIWFVGF